MLLVPHIGANSKDDRSQEPRQPVRAALLRWLYDAVVGGVVGEEGGLLPSDSKAGTAEQGLNIEVAGEKNSHNREGNKGNPNGVLQVVEGWVGLEVPAARVGWRVRMWMGSALYFNGVVSNSLGSPTHPSFQSFERSSR